MGINSFCKWYPSNTNLSSFCSNPMLVLLHYSKPLPVFNEMISLFIHQDAEMQEPNTSANIHNHVSFPFLSVSYLYGWKLISSIARKYLSIFRNRTSWLPQVFQKFPLIFHLMNKLTAFSSTSGPFYLRASLYSHSSLLIASTVFFPFLFISVPPDFKRKINYLQLTVSFILAL